MSELKGDVVLFGSTEPSVASVEVATNEIRFRSKKLSKVTVRAYVSIRHTLTWQKYILPFVVKATAISDWFLS